MLDHASEARDLVVALRNRLIHGYDEVDLAILWQILDRDLPPLIGSLRTIVQTEP